MGQSQCQFANRGSGKGKLQARGHFVQLVRIAVADKRPAGKLGLPCDGRRKVGKPEELQRRNVEGRWHETQVGQQAEGRPVDVGRDGEAAQGTYPPYHLVQGQITGGEKQTSFSTQVIALGVDQVLGAEHVFRVGPVGQVIEYSALPGQDLLERIEQAQDMDLFAGLYFHARQDRQSTPRRGAHHRRTVAG